MQDITKYWKNYINGEWVDPEDGSRIEIENPATATPIAEVARAREADVDRAVEAARACFNSRELYNMRPTNRGALMFEIARHLTEMADDIALVECLDNGKAITGGKNEALAAARYFTYYGGLADKLEGRMIPLGADYVDYTIPSPFGVSAQIVPWNFPLQIAARSVACALATANTVVLKSPELSPLSTYFIAEACHRAGVPKGAVNILCGYGHDCGAYLVSHSDVDHIVFTGSLKTGQSILTAAAKRVLPCVMELGGKSAGVMFEDADIDQVINSTASGIFSNAGQVCSAQSRLIVPRQLHDQVIEKMVAKASTLSVGPGIDGHDITPVISANQASKIEAMCMSAAQSGAQAAIGGRKADGFDGHFIEPTVFANVTADMTIAQEEVFGPVLAVLAYDDVEEAIALANGTDYGLCAGVYTRDLAMAHWAADQLVAGQVFVNEWFAGGIETPFGGTKRSGYGREKGQEALLNYVQTKNVGIRISAGGGGRLVAELETGEKLMAGLIDARLADLGITLTEAAAPAANYVPYTITGNLVFISGQVPFVDGKLEYQGKVGQDFDTEEAIACARVCALNILAQLKTACGGDLDKVTKCVKLGGFVNCVDGYTEQPKVINGASDLMVDVFGEKGRHARFAVGTNALPMNVAVEIDAVFEIA